MRILLVMALLVSSQAAHAYEIVCQGDNNSSYKILVDDHETRAAVYVTSSGREIAQELFIDGKVTAFTEAVLRISRVDETVIDWDKEQACFKYKGSNYGLMLDFVSGEVTEGYFAQSPTLHFRPGSNSENCSFPRIHPPRPVKLTCGLTN
jgi:hypothetical protein